MNKKIQKLLKEIDERVVNSQKNGSPRLHLGMSEAGEECLRKSWFTWRWAKYPIFNGRKLRLFGRGDREEVQFAYLLRLCGIQILTKDPETNRQFEFFDQENYVSGHCDGISPNFLGKKTVGEMKTHNNKQFTPLKKSQSVEISHNKHYCQTQRYMYASGSEQGLYMAVNKDNDELYFELVERDEECIERILQQEVEIITSSIAPNCVTDNPDYFYCKYFCNYYEICFGNEKMNRNCRTCENCTLPGAGKWYCREHEMDLNVKTQRLGCDDHVWIELR